jgi:hypothetical protein
MKAHLTNPGARAFIFFAMVVGLLAPVRPLLAAGKGGVIIDIPPEAPRIVIEAESGRLKGRMKVWDDKKDASGGKYVMAPDVVTEESKSSANGGAVEFALDIKKAGKYNLWLRVWWESSCDNSLAVNFCDQTEEVTDNDYGRWKWIRVGRNKSFDLAAGETKLVVVSREDGSRLDQLLLTQNLEYVPGDTAERE